MQPRNWIWLSGITVFALVAGICLATVPEKISAALNDQLEQAFSSSGIDAEYQVDGRDVVFTGEVSVNYNRTAQFALAREIAGIRNIVDQQVVYVPQPAFGQILIENGQVKFTGGFKNPSNLEHITNLIYQFFADYDIVIEAQASERMITMQQTLDYEYLFERFVGNEVWFEFSDRQVVMNGRFRSEHDRELAEQKILAQISKQTRYINDIKVTGSGESETMAFRKNAQGITVSGVLADRHLREKLISLFRGYYPDSKLDLDIQINEDLQQVTWHEHIGYLVPELGRIQNGEFRFYSEEIVLEGNVADLSTKAGLISRIKEAVDDSEIIDRLDIVQ